MTDDLIETIEVESRGYELSATGILPVSAFLRYFEHLRWRMMADKGKLAFREQVPMGVIRAQAIDIFESASFDERLAVTLWVSRLGRTSMDLSHDLIRTSTGTVVARSTATLVALDVHRRPAPIAESVRAYVLDKPGALFEGLDEAPPTRAFERDVAIRPSDQDLQRHVNQARYVDFLEDTRWFASQSGAYGPEHHWDGPAKRVVVSYESEARVGDALVARTWRAAGADRTAAFQLSVGSRLVLKARVHL